MPRSCVCLACVLCELVIQDQETRNKSLINTFNHVMVAALPAQMYRLSVLVSITDGRGEAEGRLELHDPEGVVMIRGVSRVPFRDPTVIFDLCYEFRDVSFRREGRYTVNFWLGDDLIVMRPFMVQCRQNVPPPRSDDFDRS